MRINQDELKYIMNGEKSPRIKLREDLFKLHEKLYEEVTNLEKKRNKLFYRYLTSKEQQKEDKERFGELANRLLQIVVERDKLEAGVQIFEQ